MALTGSVRRGRLGGEIRDLVQRRIEKIMNNPGRPIVNSEGQREGVELWETANARS